MDHFPSGVLVYFPSGANTPKGEVVASGSWDGTVRLWDPTTGQLMTTLDHTASVTSVAFAPGSTVLVSADVAGNLMIWSMPSGRYVATLVALSNGEWITFTPEGYFVSSEDVAQRVMMAFEREFSGGRIRERASNVSPNPAKVAEALQGIVSPTSTATRPEHPRIGLQSVRRKTLPPAPET